MTDHYPEAADGGTTLPDSVRRSVRQVAREEITLATVQLIALLKGEEIQRQHTEDTRSVRRNRNRFFTLLGALLIGICVVYFVPKLGTTGKTLGPYAFCITIALDSAFVAWSYIRRY
jgi:hypothetical protein